ncbi:hypothetical protein GMRT_13902 [Giardia muris]|uniref:Uncharacterized protein n=1 Tax=Giardia muris TaxID=5742 RepID=A0A4Z1SQ92_GIAMU|nr:hypothetical protein GMRT_13902 [Giardia muris]|eukprot:TNJ28014.1 hypothetical protein GMRT_13902 [Giardia muris]
MCDEQYISAFELTTMAELLFGHVGTGPRSELDLQRTLRDFFHGIGTGSLIKGLTWADVLEKDLFVSCYANSLQLLHVILQPRTRDDWLDACTFFVSDVPVEHIDTILRVCRLASFGAPGDPGEADWDQDLGPSGTYIHWFVAYFRRIQFLNALEAVCSLHPDVASFREKLPELADRFEAPERAFTLSAMTMALDSIGHVDYLELLTRLMGSLHGTQKQDFKG